MIHVKYNGVNNMAWRKIMLSPLIKRRIFQVAKDLNNKSPIITNKYWGKYKKIVFLKKKLYFLGYMDLEV